MNCRTARALWCYGARWAQYESPFYMSRTYSWVNLSPCNSSILHSRAFQIDLVIPGRCYASKNKVKGSTKKKQVKFSDHELAEVIDVHKMRATMANAFESLKESYVQQLSIRTATGSMESLKITFEGETFELQQIAQITRKGQQTIIVNMLAFPQMTKTVMDTLKSSKLNLNPQQEGTTIYVPVPKVTKEHREILAKKAKELFITCRDTVRKTQERYIKEVKEGSFSDDIRNSVIDQVKAVGDAYVGQAETLMKSKQDELMGNS